MTGPGPLLATLSRDTREVVPSLQRQPHHQLLPVACCSGRCPRASDLNVGHNALSVACSLCPKLLLSAQLCMQHCEHPASCLEKPVDLGHPPFKPTVRPWLTPWLLPLQDTNKSWWLGPSKPHQGTLSSCTMVLCVCIAAAE